MTQDKIEIFKTDFLYRTGIKLDVHLRSGDMETEKVNAFVNRVEMIIEEEIKTRNPVYSQAKKSGLLSERQQEAIYDAIIEQAAYIFAVGDMTMISGYDPVTGVMTPLEEIRKRTISPLAKKMLANVGLFYTGLGNKTQGGYSDRRSGWR